MSNAKQKGSYQLRVIGGTLRGRKVVLNHQAILRPTPDRVRETIFNWLMNDIQDANCLDLYAGSGILGFEALSRGASQVIAVENHTGVMKDIEKNSNLLGFSGENYQLRCQDVLEYIKQPAPLSFDVVFLDPPYTKKVLSDCLHLLSKNKWIHDESLIYIESSEAISKLSLPKGWSVYRDKKAGMVHYGLIQH